MLIPFICWKHNRVRFGYLPKGRYFRNTGFLQANTTVFKESPVLIFKYENRKRKMLSGALYDLLDQQLKRIEFQFFKAPQGEIPSPSGGSGRHISGLFGNNISLSGPRKFKCICPGRKPERVLLWDLYPKFRLRMYLSRPGNILPC